MDKSKFLSYPLIMFSAQAVTLIAAAQTQSVPADAPANSVKVSGTKYASQVEDQLIARGYDSVLGEQKRVRCVELKPKMAELGEPVPAPSTTTQIEVVESSEQIRRLASMSVSAGYNYGAANGSASGSSSYMQNFSSFKSHAVQKISVIYPDQSHVINDFRLSKFGRDLLSDVAGYPLFRLMCGDQFILGFNYGAEYSALMSAEARTEEQQISNTRALSGATTTGSFGGSTVETLNKLQSANYLQISTLRNGLQEPLPVTNFTSLETYINDFPAKVKAADAKPVVKFIVADYFSFILDFAKKKKGVPAEQPETPPWVKLLSNQLNYMLDLQRYQADLSYLMDHPDEFVAVDSPAAAARLIKVKTAIAAITAWASDCYTTQGKVCPDQTYGNLKTPSRPLRALEADFDPNQPSPTNYLTNNYSIPTILELKGRYVYGHSGANHPITVSTRLALVDLATNNEISVDIPAPTKKIVPPRTAVYFNVLDSDYSDNSRFAGEQGNIRGRLGGDPSAFISPSEPFANIHSAPPAGSHISPPPPQP